VIVVSRANKKVALELENVPPALFSTLVAQLKSIHGQFNIKTKKWMLDILQYDRVRGDLEELDTIVETFPEQLEELRCGDPELVVLPHRARADYSLVNFPPIVGKAPHENFQRESILQGLQKNRYGFFLGQGSGKSYIASVLIAHYYLRDKNVSKVLILSTAIGARNMLSELVYFIKGLDVRRAVVATKDNWKVFTDDIDIVIASYNTFRLICNRERKLQNIRSKNPKKPFLPLSSWGTGNKMLILDESHLIANSQSQQGSLVALHSQEFYYRYLFSGTPADKPEKLYNQLRVMDRSLVHNLSYHSWLEEYAELGTRFSSWAIRGWKHDKFEKLNQRVTPKYAMFLTSEELLTLPPHYIKKIYLTMTPSHRRLYESFIQEEVSNMMQSGKHTVRDVINRFPYMMLAVDNPSLLHNHSDKLATPTLAALSALKTKDLERVAAAKDIVESHDGEKGVLWVIHPKTAELYAEIFANLAPIVITGATEESERKSLVDAFQKDPKHQLLIANIDVLSTSITITAASYQVYLERSFAYVPYDQSIKRIYRIGQNKSVTTYILLYRDSLDLIRDKNLEGKGAVVKGLLRKDFLSQQVWSDIFNGLAEDNH